MQPTIKLSSLLSAIALLALTSAAPAQPAPIPSGQLTWINAVSDGEDPTAPPSPEAFIASQPFSIFRRGPAGMWTGIISWVTIYNVDEQDPVAQQKLETITGKYPWLRPPDATDLALLQTAFTNQYLVGATHAHLAAPYSVLADRILHAATGGNTVRQVAFAELLPAVPQAPFGTAYSDVKPMDLQQWLPPQDDMGQLIVDAWDGGLYALTDEDSQVIEQWHLFDAWELGKSLLRLQAGAEGYADFLNDSTIVGWDELSSNGIGVMLRLQSFCIVQESSSSPAASTPGETPGVDVNLGPLVVTISHSSDHALSLFGTVLADGRPWTNIKHKGVTLNGKVVSPVLTMSGAQPGITMSLHGRSPFTATLHAGGVAYTVVGTYNEDGKVFFPLGGITFPPGSSVVMRNLSNAVGAMDLEAVTWTGFTVNPY